ncbi:MAG: transcriptional regulator [Deltaproteobacteria bacterium]|nr:transcriptional regulator [Deltaproteobacteria bacterium]
MLNREVVLELRNLLNAAKTGVDYTARDKAACPACGHQLSTMATRPWDGGFRTRYHKCINPDCVLAMLDQSVKSIQEI